MTNIKDLSITERLERLEDLLAPKRPPPGIPRFCSHVDETADLAQLAASFEAAKTRMRFIPAPQPHMILPAYHQIADRAVRKWGRGRQMTKAIEEMAELTTAILHHDDKKADLGQVLGEAADVMVMLLQLRLIYGAAGFDRGLLLKIEARETRVQA